MHPSSFSWPQFLWLLTVFVAPPTAITAVAIWRVHLTDRHAGGRLGLWPTGAVAFLGGFVACAGWLSWSAYGRAPGWPAPKNFPTWQVVACGATVVFTCFLTAHLSKWLKSGGLAAAVGTAAGFTAALCINASSDDTGQSGVGVLLSEFGWLFVLVSLMHARTKRFHSRSS